MLLNKHKYRFIIITASIVSLYSFYFFLSNKVYLIGSDQYYYMSIADSIIESGKMENITSIPNKSIKSPQNGIALVYVLLSLLGFTHRDSQLIIVYLNYLIYLSGIYPLLKIAKYFGLRNKLPLVSLLAVYLGTWHIYRINLLAINDGIFNLLILWLVYLFIELFNTNMSLKFSSISSSELQTILGVTILTILSIQFRVNTALVLGLAIISGLVVKNYRATMISFFITVLMLLAFLSIFYYLAGTPSFEVERKLRTLFGLPSIYVIYRVLWEILPNVTAGLSPLSNSFLALCFAVFPLSMFYCLYRGYIEKNYPKIFIPFICLSGLWFTFKFQNARVIFYTFPFIYLLLLGHRKTKIIGYTFVVICFLQSFQTFFQDFRRGPGSNLFLHIYEKNISLPEKNSLLITSEAPHSYFFLNTRSFKSKLNSNGIVKIPDELTWASIENKEKIYVLGDSTYINSAYSQIRYMASTNGYELESNPITPDNVEFKGWGVVELSILYPFK